MKPSIGFKIKQLTTKLSKAKFLFFETARAVLFPKTGITILFSANEGFEKNIRRGFRLLHYKIYFNAFTPENIEKNSLLIPLNISDMRALNKFPHLIRDKLIPIPSLEAIDICDDKCLFNKTLIDKGFKEMVPKIGNDLPLPFFLKKRAAWGGNYCHLISNAEEKEEFKDLINNQDYFCQEMIKGENEYATHILFKDHKIVTSLTIKYIFFNESSINGKDKFVSTNLFKCTYLDAFATILEAIGFEGLCCFDYKVIDDKPYIFEINPRLGGSLSIYFFTFLHQLNPDAAYAADDRKELRLP
jgi:hypothetical protein